MIKIISGKFKQISLLVPKGNLIRPTSSKKKQAIFNILVSKFLKLNDKKIFQNKIILDAFAGTGSLGLEAISYGASFCYFIENNEIVIKYLDKNCRKILRTDQFKILKNKYSKFSVSKIKKIIDIVFFDPPYGFPITKKMFEIIIINNKNKIPLFVVETDIKTILPKMYLLDLVDERIFGRTKISFMSKK